MRVVSKVTKVSEPTDDRDIELIVVVEEFPGKTLVVTVLVVVTLVVICRRPYVPTMAVVVELTFPAGTLNVMQSVPTGIISYEIIRPTFVSDSDIETATHRGLTWKYRNKPTVSQIGKMIQVNGLIVVVTSEPINRTNTVSVNWRSCRVRD